jgi:hypothetical protein
MAEVLLDTSVLTADAPLVLDSILSAAAEDGNKFLLKGTNMIIVHNDGASPIAVTLAMVGESNTGQVDDVTVSVAAGGYALINPSEHWRFADDIGSYCHLTYADHTDLEVGMVRLALAGQ